MSRPRPGPACTWPIRPRTLTAPRSHFDLYRIGNRPLRRGAVRRDRSGEFGLRAAMTLRARRSTSSGSAGTGVSYRPSTSRPADRRRGAACRSATPTACPGPTERPRRGAGSRPPPPDRRAGRHGPVRGRRRRPAGDLGDPVVVFGNGRATTASRPCGVGAVGRDQPARDPDRHRGPGGPRPPPRKGGQVRMATRLAVMFGGRSGEHEVSRRSGASIVAAWTASRYEVVPVLITPRRRVARRRPRRRALPQALRVLRAEDVVFPALHGPYGEDGTVAVAAGDGSVCRTSATVCSPARRAWTRSSPSGCSTPRACGSARG